MSDLDRIGATVRTVLEDGEDAPYSLASLTAAVEAKLADDGVGPMSEDAFLELLSQLREDVWIVPIQTERLAVPAGRPDAILDGEIKYRLRPDIFGAFATFGGPATWYLPDKDCMVGSKDSQRPSESAVLVEPTTTELELDIRRDFIDSIAVGEPGNALAEALEDPRPFAAFSRVLHQTPFVHLWNAYRFGRIFTRIWEWLDGNGLEWHPGWLVAVLHPVRSHLPGRDAAEGANGGEPARARDGREEENDRSKSRPTTSNQRGASSHNLALQHLSDALAALPPAELSRISIPADLVLKMMDRDG